MWRGTAWRLKSVQARLNLLRITIFREAHLLGIDECEETTELKYRINHHWWLWMMPAAEVPIDAKLWAEVIPPWWYGPWTTPTYEPGRDKNHQSGTAWHLWCGLASGVEVRRSWGPRLRSGGNGSIECRNSGQEESDQLGIPFFRFCHLFSSPGFFTAFVFGIV
jgi:hypothetical protein